MAPWFQLCQYTYKMPLFLLLRVRHLSDNVEWMTLGRWCSFWVHSETAIIFHPQNGKWLVKWRHLWQNTAWKTTVFYKWSQERLFLTLTFKGMCFISFTHEISMHFNYKINSSKKEGTQYADYCVFSWHKLLLLLTTKILINTFLNDNLQYIIFKNLCIHAYACVHVQVYIPLECHWPPLR